jgi:ribosomal protein S12 methylthiotransferase
MRHKKDRINVITLGCSKNVVDSEVLMNQLKHNNMQLAENEGDADIAVINSCGFIDAAKDESIETILQAVELKKDGKLKKVIVMGCLSERYAKELQKEIPEVDLFIGANKLDKVVQALGGDYKYELLGERLLTTPKHYAYLKISEGCDNPCSFCAIPLIRGKHVSKPIEQIVHEAEQLAILGVKELIIIAQDSTYYGLDLYGKRILGTLLEKLSQVHGVEWLRLMYTYPAQFPLDVLDQFKSNQKLCRYLDLPIQHISDNILKSMRRGMSSRALREFVAQVRWTVPDIALRTTIIVGYPIEGEKEFNELIGFVKETEFDRLGVFTYSQEDDTAAYELSDPIPQEVKEERRAIIMELQQEISLNKNRQLIGQTTKVLIDQVNSGTAIGRTEKDAPEVDNEVTIQPADQLSTGNFYTVKIVDADEYDLFAVSTNQVNYELEKEKVS